jgi:integrase
VKARSTAGLQRITLHECRHTYASLLMAAGYTRKELMEFLGRADLQMVNRYMKRLPQPTEFSDREYRKHIRALGDDYLAMVPRRIA